MDTTLIALAGLLHDIGKFAGRAEVSPTQTWDADAQRDYRYRHALLSADFVGRYIPEAWRAAVLGPVARHHRPQTAAERLVTLADRLSSSERIQDRPAAPEDDGPRVRHPKQLETSFYRLKTEEGALAPGQPYLPLRELALDKEAIFPAKPLGADDAWRAYDALWEQFTAAAVALKQAHESNGNPNVYLESFLHLLQRFAWCIPSAYFKDTPDISLYDHSRMTAALAAVLARQALPDDEAQRWLRDGVAPTRPIALLIGGDLSGVQQFIYTITARGATPALRGRSAYLQLLTELLARHVLRALGLPLTNLIYAGGGNFYLLAAPADAERLPELRTALSRILLTHHEGDLYLALAAQPLHGADLHGPRLGAAWGQLHSQFQSAKQRRFSELGDAIGALFAVPQAGGQSDHLCVVCGREHPQTAEDKKAREEDGSAPRKCPPCFSYETLGDALRAARYLQLLEADPPADLPAAPGEYDDVFAALGYRLEIADSLDRLSAQRRRQTVYTLYGADAADPPHLPLRAVGRKLFVNATPIISQAEIDALREKNFPDDLPVADSVKPFSVLARQARGIRRLGVLRMDVDNLGRLFSDGLGDRASLSRVAALSFAVSLYFEGWVARLAAQQSPHDGNADRLYSIYSGGDDLFFVGAWDAVVELAMAVRRDLADYAAGHPGVHASAGIALVTQKYPLYQAAADAGEAEHAAKALVWQADGQTRTKDAVAFLGQALPWARFGLSFAAADRSAAAPLAAFLAADKARGPLIRRLSALHAQYAEAAEQRRLAGLDRTRNGQPQLLYGRWNYLAAYILHRLGKQNEQDKEEIVNLDNLLRDTQFQSIIWIGLAARWADLLTR